jgi:hypothetical protein
LKEFIEQKIKSKVKFFYVILVWRIILVWSSKQVSVKQVYFKQVKMTSIYTYSLLIVLALYLSPSIMTLVEGIIIIKEIPKCRIPYSSISHCWVHAKGDHLKY